LAPVTVLIGRSGVGKSSFLRAIRFLRNFLLLNGDAAIQHEGGWPRIWPFGKPAPQTGRYRLYASDNSKLIRKAMLREGDKIGFARDAQGRLAAVAGVKIWRLHDGNYYWLLPSEDDAADALMSFTLQDLAEDAAEFAVYAALGYLQAWLEGDTLLRFHFEPPGKSRAGTSIPSRQNKADDLRATPAQCPECGAKPFTL
jgi:hypothetical protein